MRCLETLAFALSLSFCTSLVLAEESVDLGSDPQRVILSWDAARSDLPRTKEGPTLQFKADGTVLVADPHGAGQPVEGKLTTDELQQLLQTIVREHGFFAIDPATYVSELRAARRKAGLSADGPALFNIQLQLHVNGKTHEVRCADLAANAERTPAARKLFAIQEQLEKLKAWAYAGGNVGVEAALKLANDALLQDFPEAAPLAPDDLRSAIQRTNGSAQIVFERRGVAPDKNRFSFIYASVDKDSSEAPAKVTVRASLSPLSTGQPALKQVRKGPFAVDPPPIATDPTIHYDYPIVYIRAPRDPDNLPEFANTHPPTMMPGGSELVLLQPSGAEEVLVPAGATEAITDPYVSFDGEWVYYVRLHNVSKRENHSGGSDVYKIHVPSRKVVQLTRQGFTPNTGTVDLAKQLKNRGVYNLGPCPLPGGKVAFTSDRNAFRAAPGGTGHPLAQQLFVMDEDGANVETIGHLNLGGILHPVILKDGRIIFTTNETQGLRGGYFFWGVWSIHPDGTNWNPVISAYDGDVFHFYTQLSDEQIVLTNYYPGGVTRGFGTYHKMPHRAPDGEFAFGPANSQDPRNRTGPTMGSMPFKPYGLDSLTLFATKDDVRPNSGFGKVTHPSGAPDNHLLTCWALCATPKDATDPIDAFSNPRPKEAFDSGLYLIKSGQPINQPGQMVLIKNDAKYHELFPRALVSYKRIYGVDEPARLASPANDGKLCKHMPEGVPYGLVGSSSLYKRESYPQGTILPGKVTAEYSQKSEQNPFFNLGGTYANGRNWIAQGADAGIYDNSDIHAIRIVITEPVSSNGNHKLQGHASNFQEIRAETPPSERLRILGEFPVRKFKDGVQPVDPDGNPDTSFEAKIPADVAWTFQTLDKRGMVLNMAQTWHQVRPGERRNDCGGCHAHSQKPTEFKLTMAAKPDYKPWDLTGDKHPLLTTKDRDESGQQWDQESTTGVRFAKSITNVEYHRDVKPILQRSCVACHTKDAEKPAGNLVLDDDALIRGLPGTYYRLAMDSRAEYGHKPLDKTWGGYVQITRYVRKLQSRRSLLIWKIYGERLDGFNNDDFATETVIGDPKTLTLKGTVIEPTHHNVQRADLDYSGSIMPPKEAVAEGKVKPLSEEDRLTLVRWIDLGCPLDRDYDPEHPEKRGTGWMVDDYRPTLAVTSPRAGANGEPLNRLLIGLHDYYSGLDMDSLVVTADFDVDDVPAGENLAQRFRAKGEGVFELPLARPVTELAKGTLSISIEDQEGNVTRMDRTFSIAQ
jgi:hypothetical protein